MIESSHRPTIVRKLPSMIQPIRCFRCADDSMCAPPTPQHAQSCHYYQQSRARLGNVIQLQIIAARLDAELILVVEIVRGVEGGGKNGDPAEVVEHRRIDRATDDLPIVV